MDGGVFRALCLFYSFYTPPLLSPPLKKTISGGDLIGGGGYKFIWSFLYPPSTPSYGVEGEGGKIDVEPRKELAQGWWLVGKLLSQTRFTFYI